MLHCFSSRTYTTIPSRVGREKPKLPVDEFDSPKTCIKYRTEIIVKIKPYIWNNQKTISVLSSQGYIPLTNFPQETVQSPELSKIPRLEHKLERCLFNGGLSTVIPPIFRDLGKLRKIDISKYDQFLPPSKDMNLLTLGKTHNCTVVSSTSSYTDLLSHIYFLFSRFKPVNISSLPTIRRSKDAHHNFAPISHKPYMFKLTLQEGGIYSMDKWYNPDTTTTPKNQVLLLLGKTMELSETYPAEIIESLMNNTNPTWRPEKECFHYSRVNNTLLRAQIDCYHPDLPKQFFDIKVRANQSIRYNIQNEKFHRFTGRNISVNGLTYSFEKEDYDKIRSGVLKYIFQARIGTMDGMFVNYHNLESVLGFQYFPVKKMEENIFETQVMADKSYEVSTNFASYLLNYFKDRFNSADLKVIAQCKEKNGECFLSVYIENLSDGSLHKFKANLEVFINNKSPKGSFLLHNPDDNIVVLHKITPIDMDPIDLQKEFQWKSWESLN